MKNEIGYFNPTVKVLTKTDRFLINMFDSGEFPFNNFLNSEALKDMKNGDGVTYLIVNEKQKGKQDLVAYYTISTGAINIVDRLDFDDNEMPEKEKKEHYLPISAFMIKMFAVNEKYQDCYFDNKLISSLILKNIISELYDMSTSIIGAKRIILCSVPEAVNFYEKNEFEVLTNKYTILDKADALDNTPMYLTLHDI
ncbi:hypothetical protein DVV91_09795 [Clostridium botulinum]|uniref:hypothetical protein n=1 Tax=Clostridium botulinum TaxID=1491 RepID=UPI0019683CD6|nr:hypothetical protein [Clostridium botulinum]MBN1074632.1 hypothetical protein [Clostridium botulinum]